MPEKTVPASYFLFITTETSAALKKIAKLSTNVLQIMTSNHRGDQRSWHKRA